MKKVVVIVLLCFCLMGCSSTKFVYMDLYKVDNANQTHKKIKRYKLEDKQFIKLDKYDGNDLKVLEIDNKYVKVSRNIIMNNGNKDNCLDYKKKVISKISYNTIEYIDKNKKCTNLLASQSRYYYYIIFTKK